MGKHEDRRREINLNEEAAAGWIDFACTGRCSHQARVGARSLAGIVIEDRLKLFAKAREVLRLVDGEAQALARNAQTIVINNRTPLAGAIVAGFRNQAGETALGRDGFMVAIVATFAAVERACERRGGGLSTFSASDLGIDLDDLRFLGAKPANVIAQAIQFR